MFFFAIWGETPGKYKVFDFLKTNKTAKDFINEKGLTQLSDTSEIEGLIKFLLQNGQLSYNPDCRVMNYSMGLPKTNEVL